MPKYPRRRLRTGPRAERKEKGRPGFPARPLTFTLVQPGRDCDRDCDPGRSPDQFAASCFGSLKVQTVPP